MMRRTAAAAALLAAGGGVVISACARTPAAPGGVRDRPGKAIAITAVSAHRGAAGEPFLRVRVRGTALDTAVRVAGRARLTGGPGGAAAGPFLPRWRVVVAPGHSAAMTFVLPPGLPAGPWRARITVTNGRDAALVRTALAFPGGRRTWLRTYLVPVSVWLSCVALALVIIAGVTVAHFREARRPRQSSA